MALVSPPSLWPLFPFTPEVGCRNFHREACISVLCYFGIKQVTLITSSGLRQASPGLTSGPWTGSWGGWPSSVPGQDGAAGTQVVGLIPRGLVPLHGFRDPLQVAADFGIDAGLGGRVAGDITPGHNALQDTPTDQRSPRVTLWGEGEACVGTHSHLHHHSESQTKPNPAPPPCKPILAQFRRTRFNPSQSNPISTQHSSIQPMSNCTLHLSHSKCNLTHVHPHLQHNPASIFSSYASQTKFISIPHSTSIYFPSENKPNSYPSSRASPNYIVHPKHNPNPSPL